MTMLQILIQNPVFVEYLHILMPTPDNGVTEKTKHVPCFGQ